jgi:uncharacterized protein YbjQ (UPF0145 family)
MKYVTVVASLVALMVSPLAMSRDTKHMLSLQDALNTPEAKERLTGAVRFYFGDQKYPSSAQTLMSVVANRKTNAFNKSDEEACKWVFLSAMISLQERAIREGANAVVGINSYYKKNEVSSNTQYECHAGNIMAGVALKGTVARLP